MLEQKCKNNISGNTHFEKPNEALKETRKE